MNSCLLGNSGLTNCYLYVEVDIASVVLEYNVVRVCLTNIVNAQVCWIVLLLSNNRREV